MTATDLTHALAARINIQLLKLYRLQSKLQQLEAEIASFLQDYFSALEKQLRPLLPTIQDTLHTPLQKAHATDIASHLHTMEQLLKQLYRQLAKHYHPDSGTQGDTTVMSRINHAYAQKELGSLMLLHHAVMPADSIAHSHQDLLHYQQMIGTLTLQAEQALEALERSEANRLRAQMLVARLNGINFMEEIAAKLQKKYRKQAISV